MNGADRVLVDPHERRAAIVGAIERATHRLALAIFRCDDFGVLDAIHAAARRGVEVRVLLTARARGWRRRLADLEVVLASMGVRVMQYADPVQKYHAKYLVADDEIAQVMTLNLTRHCLDETCDFVLETSDPEVVRGLSTLFDRDAAGTPAGVWPGGGRLVVAPDAAAPRVIELLAAARERIRIVDHKLSDPGVLEVLGRKRAEGVDVSVIGGAEVSGRPAHGKLLVVDDAWALVGSLALSSISLSFRREVALLSSDRHVITRLQRFVDAAASGA
jgi:phosphatidylserine/phosphatidylglycerophosphate/cardiolipin synthase-like enzyme